MNKLYVSFAFFLIVTFLFSYNFIGKLIFNQEFDIGFAFATIVCIAITVGLKFLIDVFKSK